MQQRADRDEGSVKSAKIAQFADHTGVGEPDPAQCLALADRIAALHTEHGQEPAIREQLASIGI